MRYSRMPRTFIIYSNTPWTFMSYSHMLRTFMRYSHVPRTFVRYSLLFQIFSSALRDTLCIHAIYRTVIGFGTNAHYVVISLATVIKVN